jgi:hypothetical protein
MKRALALLLLAAACTSGSKGAAPSGTPSPTPSTSPSPVDPYTALAPPDSPGIGDSDAALANRAYAAAQGLLAEALLERDTLLGKDLATVATDLAGASQDSNVLRDVRTATEAGLSYRPLLGKGLTVADKGFAEVVRSEWSGDQVTGRGGETGLKISWSGAIRYTVTAASGTESQIAYALQTSWVFTPDTRVPGGLELVATLKGTAHIQPQLPTCNAKGVIVPVGQAPVAADFSEGPYPSRPVPSGVRCPV